MTPVKHTLPKVKILELWKPPVKNRVIISVHLLVSANKENLTVHTFSDNILFCISHCCGITDFRQTPRKNTK